MLLSPPASPKLAACSASSAPEARLGQFLQGGIQLTEILGVGAYGVVYKAIDVKTGVYYAVKALNKVGLEARQQTFQQREIELHHQVSQHPHVVSLQKIYDTPDCTYVVLEYCPEGDLFTKITDEQRYVGNDELARRVFLQILSAVEHCHSIGIYHRDLKPENILVKDNGFNVKLADFGLATTEFYTSDFGCGSTFYMSPECQQTSNAPFTCYSAPANDVWSLGVILVNLACGRNPWKRACMEDSTYRQYVSDRGFLKTILPISDDLDRILSSVFDPTPLCRPSVHDLRNMIMTCSSFTRISSPIAPSTPPYSPVMAPMNDAFLVSAPYNVTPQSQTQMDFQMAAQTLATRFSGLTTEHQQRQQQPNPYHNITARPPRKAAVPRTPAPSPYLASTPKMCTPQTFFGSTFLPWCNNLGPVAFNLSKHATFLPPRVF